MQIPDESADGWDMETNEYHVLGNLNTHPKTLPVFRDWLKGAFKAVRDSLEHEVGIEESDLEFCTAVVRRASLTASRLGAGHLAEPFHVQHLHASALAVLGRMLAWVDGQLKQDAWLSVADVADRLGVSQDKVLAWIRSGELRATNVARKGSAKPIWKIDPEDFKSFALLHSNAGTEKPRRQKRRAIPPDVIQFYH